MAVANRTGSETRNDETLSFNGDSVIYDYQGNILIKAGAIAEEIIIAEIEPAKTRKKNFNEFNNIFSDRRPDMYEL